MKPAHRLLIAVLFVLLGIWIAVVGHLTSLTLIEHLNTLEDKYSAGPLILRALTWVLGAALISVGAFTIIYTIPDTCLLAVIKRFHKTPKDARRPDP